jgi:hypothetical protein
VYNSSVRFACIAIVLILSSCSKDINNKEAVKEAVMKRLASVSGLNTAGMDVEVTGVSFQDNRAEAQVAFRAKGSAENMLNMSYKLEREGDVWVVKSSSGGMGGGGGMGAGGGMPPGHPPASQGAGK